MKDAVGTFNDVSTIEFDTEGKPDIPVFDPNGGVSMPKVNYDPQYNPFKASSSKPASGIHTSKLGGEQNFKDFDTLYSQLLPDQDSDFPAENSDEASLFAGPVKEESGSIIDEKSPLHYQYKGKYIMSAVKSGLMIIDQHRAHVRILFEDYRKRLDNKKMHSQKVLFPQSVDFTPQEIVTMTQITDDISAMGFELSSLGGNTYAINAIPEGFDGIDIPSLLHDILTDASEETGNTQAMVKIHDSLALSLARAAAIPYGQVLNNDEMENIINNLFQCSNVNYTPDGLSILCILKQKDIEKMLG